jgi:hypothetical protein
MSKKEKSEKKCIAVHLPIDLLDKINEYKAKTGKSQSGLLIDMIEKGLGISQHDKVESKVLFFVKARIDETKIVELGQKMQSGELDTSQIIMTYCIKEDPTVGISFWQASTKINFEEIFARHRFYYKEVIEIIPVITPMESMKLIMENMQG